MKKATPSRAELERWENKALRELAKILDAAVDRSDLYALAWRNKICSLPWTLSVRFADTPEMTRINGRWRGKKEPTDILSFPAPEVFRDQGMLGELVVCLPVLQAQARESGHSPSEELRVLLVHGVLHLLGLDHEKSRYQLAKQARLEGELLAALGSKARSGLIDRMRPASKNRKTAGSRRTK